MASECFVVLDVGRKRIKTKGLVDGESILAVERGGDALVILWARDVLDLDPPEEAGEELMGLVGAEILERHRDTRGILAYADDGRDLSTTGYAALVARHASTGRWLANLSGEPGAVPDRDMRREIPLRNARCATSD